MKLTAKDIARFETKYLKRGPDDCWEWQKYGLPRGYGQFRVGYTQQLAHRVAYLICHGVLADDLQVMHSCDNPKCVNPAHLSQGDKFANMRDAKRKGRMAKCERHGRSKLTEEQARWALVAPGLQREVADALGVSQTIISEIRAGKKWAHIER